MVEFNPDGSIKLTGRAAENKARQENRMKSQQTIKVRKDLVCAKPKKCILHLTKSDALRANINIDTIFNYFQSSTQTPMKLLQLSDKEYQVEVGSDFNRCRECTQLVNRLREIVDGNIIVDKGSCTYQNSLSSSRSFSYEDYFD